MQDEPNRQRGDPSGPETIPTGLLLWVSLIVLIGVVVIGAIFVTAGIGGMLAAALVAIVVGVPLAIRKFRRPADNPQSVEEEKERQEHEAALHPPMAHHETSEGERSSPPR
jgi:hypothetical protein